MLNWIGQGGNVGISLHFNKPGAPPNPLRLFAFDDDDGTTRAWLAERGITSPWIVNGRRGCHVYALLPEGVPDLLTKYNALKPETPKLDVKTSGLMVLPMKNGKRLELEGQEVTSDNLHLLDRFTSLESLQAWLPKVDPRSVIPGMKERESGMQELEEASDGQETTAQKPGAAESPSTSSKAKKPKKPRQEPAGSLYLSAVRPSEGSYHPNYHGIPYYERRRLAGNHAQKVQPSIPGNDPWGKLVKVVNDCIHNYGMSDRTTWEVVRDRFNSRCKTVGGRPYPWTKSAVVKTIKWAHEEGRYSTMAKLESLADPEKVRARLKQKGEEANARRASRRQEQRDQMNGVVSAAMQELGYVTWSSWTETVRPHASLTNGTVRFRGLYEELEALLRQWGESVPTEKGLGGWLGSLGLETYRGRIRSLTLQGTPLPKAG